MNLMFRHGMTPTQRLIWLKRLTGGGDGSVLKTVTGTLLHITDALAKPAKNFTATLEPEKVTGKNLFNKNDFVRNEGYINPNANDYRTGEGRVTAVLPDPIPPGTYTISRATSARLRVGLVTSTTLSNEQAIINKTTGTNNSDSPVTITVSQSGYYLAIFFKDTADADEQNLLDHLQVEVGSSATSYEDYTCTLKGYTVANVTRTGVNVWDEEWEEGTINATNGNNQTGASYWRTKNYIPIKPSTEYIISSTEANKASRLRFYDKDKGYIGTAPASGTGYTNTPFTTPSNAYYMRFAPDKSVIPEPNGSVSVNYPSTDTDYHAYSGQTIPITFPVLGKNLLDMSDANIEVGKYIDNSGAEKTNASNFYNSAYIPVKASTAYTLGTSSGIKYCSFMEYDANKTFIKRTLYGNGSTPFTTQSHTMGDTTAFVLVGSNPTGSTIDLAGIKAINWMFNEGSTAETYEPYTSTVYGGTLDVTSGLLKVYPYYDSYNGETLTGHWISNKDTYADGKTPTIGAEVVNDGATPTTHQITPTEIDLLQGENNIWTDTNSDLELKYYATSE